MAHGNSPDKPQPAGTQVTDPAKGAGRAARGRADLLGQGTVIVAPGKSEITEFSKASVTRTR